MDRVVSVLFFCIASETYLSFSSLIPPHSIVLQLWRSFTRSNPMLILMAQPGKRTCRSQDFLVLPLGVSLLYTYLPLLLPLFSIGLSINLGIEFSIWGTIGTRTRFPFSPSLFSFCFAPKICTEYGIERQPQVFHCEHVLTCEFILTFFRPFPPIFHLVHFRFFTFHPSHLRISASLICSCLH